MPNKKISQFTTVGSINSDDVFLINQTGTTNTVTMNTVSAAINTIISNKFIQKPAIVSGGEVLTYNGSTATWVARSDESGFRNRIINGDMRIDQRNAGVAATIGAGVNYTLDRWAAWRTSGVSGSTAQRVAGYSGFQYALRMQRTSSNASTADLALNQIFESTNILDLAGQTVTLSFYAKAGANYSAASSSISCAFGSSTSIDQSSAGAYNGTWPGLAGTSTSVAINSSSATRVTLTYTVPANMQSLTVQISYTPTGTAGAADYVDITGVQLEKGTTATPFEFRPIGTELALCQRYYELMDIALATYAAAAGSFYAVRNSLKVSKRSTPVLTTVSQSFTNAGAIAGGLGNGANSTVYWSVSASTIGGMQATLILSADSEL